jgi:hypothetical protein
LNFANPENSTVVSEKRTEDEYTAAHAILADCNHLCCDALHDRRLDAEQAAAVQASWPSAFVTTLPSPSANSAALGIASSVVRFAFTTRKRMSFLRISKAGHYCFPF